MPETQLSQSMFTWIFEAYERHERGLIWYSVAGLIVGSFLVYGIATGNFLFGVLVIIITAILFLRHVQDPQEIVCTVDDKKMVVDGKAYDFERITLFWIIKNTADEWVLYIQEQGSWHGMLAIPLEKQDPETLRTHLRQYIVESIDHKFEPFFDSLFRILKI